MARLILVSNRLPFTIDKSAGDVRLVPSSGGLATGLRGAHARLDGVWVGWPGPIDELDEAQRRQVDAALAEARAIPLSLSKAELAGYYDGFSNRVVWPLFHYLLERVPMKERWWEEYRRVNERFARLVAEQYRPGDIIWVHDYQLMLVPQMLRALVPDAKIGFFLHIPFPSTEVLRILPWRAELLQGLLGADLVGFHTFTYLRHFARSLLRVLGVQLDIDRVRHEGRSTRVGVFPMGIDAAAFAGFAAEPEVEADRAALVGERPDQRILLGIDRLDYTKGLPLRLQAVERLLEREPALRGKVRLVQIAVPTRTEIDAYRGVRRKVDEAVGRINGAYGTVDWMPIHHLFQSVSQRRLTALYRAASVMLVTPVRDGMNLVAKEFAAARTDEDGVLLLSEFAGAADELGGAVRVNPYDVGGTAHAIAQALQMEPEERQMRMRRLRERVLAYDVHRWVDTFLTTLGESDGPREVSALAVSSPRAIARLARRASAATELVVMLDYDGTLMPYGPVPAMVEPDEDLRALLTELSARAGTIVHIVSGRGKSSLERWFGTLPIGLHAEHGMWSRMAPGDPWAPNRPPETEWKVRVRPILEQFTDRVPGAFVEDKDTSIAWHYRLAETELGELQARQLCLHLGEVLKNVPVEVLLVSKRVEVKLHGVHKGLVVPMILEASPPDPLVIAIGDDRSDEDLFQALPAGSIALQVGAPSRLASHRVADTRAVRAFLWSIARQADRESVEADEGVGLAAN